MKAVKLGILATLLCLSVIALSLCASALVMTGKCGDNITYTLDTETGILDLTGHGKMYDYTRIEEGTVRNTRFYPSTPWGKDYLSAVRTVHVGEGITHIGNLAFSNTAATTVTLPSSLQVVGNSAFSSTKIEDIELPENLTEIADGAFESCKNLTEIRIPDSVTKIGNSCFSYCTNLAEIKMSASIEEITSWAFTQTAWYDNQPDGIIYLGDIVYSAKGDMVGDFAVKEGTRIIANSAFYNCSTMTSIELPDSLLKIGGSAFSGCSALNAIAIPDSVTYIGIAALTGCTNLKEVTVPFVGASHSPESNLEAVFGYLFGYQTITKAPSYSTIPAGYTYQVHQDGLYYCFKIPQSIKTVTVTKDEDIGDAFTNCRYLTSFKILNPVCSIGSNPTAIDQSTTIYGFAGSTAEAYATKYNRKFIALTPTSLTATASAATYASGTATLRVTATPTVTEGMEVERYGVFFAPAKYADSYATNGQVVVKEGAIASGKPFFADLTDIPESAYDVKIYAWAFVKLVGVSDPVVCPLDPVSIHDIVK